MNNIFITDGFELCVICGKPTSVPASLPVQWREDYELGCGQVCSACRQELRKITQNQDMLSHEKIILALDACKKEGK